MSNIVNLNKARKSKAREAARKVADENAVKFGRTKSQKSKDKTEAAKAKRDLDGHKRE